MYVETFSSDIWNCRRGEHMTKRVTKKAERKTGQRTVQGRNRADEKFIMLPTVDFCFKELMQNAKGAQRNYSCTSRSESGRD